MATTYEKGKLYHLSITDFRSDPDQPRKYFDPHALTELAESIRKHGIIQPVLFCPSEQGWLTVVAGERRVAAAKIAGLEVIPAIMVDGNTDEIALVENLQRKDLMPLEEAEALDRIMKRHGYKQEELVPVVGKAKSSIAEILSLNRLPEEIKNECRQDPSVPRYILIEIAKSKQERGMITLWKKYKDKQLSKAQLKEQSQTGRKTKEEMLTSSVNTLKSRIENTDLSELDDAGRQNLLSVFNDLKQSLDAFLSNLQSPAPETEATPIVEAAPVVEEAPPPVEETPPKVKKTKKKKPVLM